MNKACLGIGHRCVYEIKDHARTLVLCCLPRSPPPPRISPPRHLFPWQSLPKENMVSGECDHRCHSLHDPPHRPSPAHPSLSCQVPREAALTACFKGLPWPLASYRVQKGGHYQEIRRQEGKHARVFPPSWPLPRRPQLQLCGPLFQPQVSWVIDTTPPAVPPVLGSQQQSTAAGPGGQQNPLLNPLNLPPL